MAVVRNIIVRVGANADTLQKTMQKASKDVSKFGKDVKASTTPLSGMKDAFGKMVGLFPQLKPLQNIFGNIGKTASSALTPIKAVNVATAGIKAAAVVAVAGVAALAASAVGLGKAFFDVGMKYDTAFNKIRFSTAETGAKLDSLKDSFKKIYTSSAMPIQDITDSMISVYQRLGLTGKALEELSKAESRYSKVSQTDLNQTVLTTTRTFGDWGVKTKDMVKTLDMMYVATAKTGVPTMRLNELVTQFGGPMRQFGFSLESSVALLGKFEKEGVNTELVMGAMRRGIGKWSKEGKDLEKSLIATIKEIKNAGSASEANSKSIEIFGIKAGPDMAAAIREGRFNIEELTNTLKNNKTTLADAAADTATFAGKWEMAKRDIEGVLEPIGSKLVDALQVKAFPAIKEVASAITTGLDPAMEYLAGSTDESKKKIAGHTKAIQEEYPWLKDTKTALDDMSKAFNSIDVGQLVKNLGTVIGALAKVIKFAQEVINAIHTIQQIGPTMDAAFASKMTGSKSIKNNKYSISSSGTILPKSLFGKDAPLPGQGLHGYASGTTSAPGGLAIVGEQGPELVNLPRGAQVFTANNTKNMIANSSKTAKTMASSFGKSFASALQITSPSKVFAYYGKMINQGLVQGLKSDKDKAKEVMTDIINSLMENTRKLMDFGGLFDKVSMQKYTGMDFIRGMKSQITVMNSWKKSIETLGIKLGAKSPLYQQLLQLGPESAGQLRALAGMSDAQLKQLTDLYNQKSSIAMAWGGVMGKGAVYGKQATNQIILNITGNTIAKDYDVDRIMDRAINKMRAAGVY
jgi:TP901 family phage tail tape measure protein